MPKSASAMTLSAFAALAVAWFWFRHSEPTISSLPETHNIEPDASSTGSVSAVASVAAVENNATESDTSPVAAHDDGVAKTAKEIFDAFDRGVTPTFVDYLTSKGLSREDSERIVAEGVRDMTTCLGDALRAQASAQAVPFEGFLKDAMKAQNRSAALLPERALSCLTNVRQRMGLPAVSLEVGARESTVTFRAWLSTE